MTKQRKQLDSVKEILTILLEDNKKIRKDMPEGPISSYFGGKIDAYSAALQAVKNAEGLYSDES